MTDWKPNKKTVQKINTIIEQYKKEGSMTLRRCYYVLVGKHLIKNSKSSYIILSKLLKQARIEGYLPYETIEDSARNIYKRTTYSTFQDAFDKLCDRFKKNCLDSQKLYLEVWIEKEAISNIIYPITYSLDIPLIVSKGFTSVTFKKDAADRFNDASNNGKKSIILFISDFDCEGEYIPKILKENLVSDYGCYADFEIKKVLLNFEDIATYNLISNIDYEIKDKQKEKIYVRDFISKFGVVQYELDALPFDVLQQKVREAITQHIDVSISELNDDLSKEEVETWKKVYLKEQSQ